MLLQRFYNDKLAQASYLLGCEVSREALVLDPNRDAEQYVRAAKAAEMRITHVSETHVHADFVSGCRELVRRTGARLYLSAEGGADWRYLYAEEDGAQLLKNGDTFDVGGVRLEARHTPGHSPEHLSFIVTDTRGADRPMGIFTGDFVFVGDVGRPDLLERAARLTGTMDAAARTLFTALQEFKRLPDYLQVWPGHGAGSACGKSLSAMPQSTVGYELRFNWALGVAKEDEFVSLVLAGQPDPPKYFAEMKRVNRDGPRVLGGFSKPERVDPTRLADVVASGAIVIDTRPTTDYAAGHLPRTINIPFNSSFTTRAGRLVPYGREVYLLVAEGEQAAAAVAAAAARDLSLIGLDRVAGYFDAATLADVGRLEKLPQMNTGQLAERLGDGQPPVVLDVRERDEWEAGHIAGALNVPLGHLSERIAELERDRPLVLHCQSGGRSSVGASVLRAHGFSNVINLTDGFTGWQRRGLPVERPAPAEASAPGSRGLGVATPTSPSSSAGGSSST
ncbi:MAG: MBL fold metallo-hydrolase [Gemmatimonadota bacterium]|nr:MBL fold metallo-hydrolase [Gemmatimonadota bacterium]